jgi:murein DD-endopeptidase MepM/ murein hydrolase activator NlpD
MANEFYTLIVVPHAKARFRKVQVSVRLLKWVLGGVASLTLVVMGVLVHYSRIAFEVHELRRLRSENTELREKTLAYEQNAGKLQSKLEQLQSIVNKLGVMAGLEQSLPPAGAPIAGVGGPTGVVETETPPLGSTSLVSMDHELTSLTARSAQLEEFYRDQHALLSSTPSVWPVRGYLSASFGNRADPFTGQRDFHPGIDVSTPIGTRVQAPADGLVVSCAERGAYGYSIIIDHGFGIVTRYGHLSGYNVKPGARVRRGEVIGFVGNTGRSTGPHLHYEVWVRDQAQNPIHYILDEYRSFG